MTSCFHKLCREQENEVANTMYLKGNLRESSSALLLSYPSLFLLLHLSSSSYSIIFLLNILYFSLLLIRTLSILLHHLPPLASMPPRIPIFSYSHPFSSLSASSFAFPLLRIPHSPLFRIPSSISLSFFLITSPISLSLPFLFYLLISLPLFPILAFPIPLPRIS